MMRAVVMGMTLLLAGCEAKVTKAPDLPKDTDVLFWTVPQRDAAFRLMEKFGPANPVLAGDDVFDLPIGPPIKLSTDIDQYMKDQRNVGLIIVQDGQTRLEKYGMDYNATGRWTSFSVAKSFTSTLVGAALKDGYIKSLGDKVTAYIPDLKGSAYDDVTIRQLLTMTSGIKWNEDYSDPKSDVALFNKHKPDAGVDATVSYMRKLPRAAPAGSTWVYNTGETNLIGVLVSSATKKKLSDYLSEKIWKPFGMQQDAAWLQGATGHEISGCCISASLRDYARMGQFMLGGGVAAGQKILPDDWIAQATRKQADIGAPGTGYGFQWWTYDDGSYAAQGIFGQGIFIDPARKLVIATNGNWLIATDDKLKNQRDALYRQVQKDVDAMIASRPSNATAAAAGSE